MTSGCESGRSMVEMLGVLAVMGLLTIIGIAGFRVAMNKHYANQTVQRLMKRAVVVAAQANFGQTLSLREFDENDGEYPIPNPDTLEHNSGVGYVDGKDGYCDCAEGYYMDEKNQCLSCPNIIVTVLQNPEDCHKCINAQGKPTHFRINLGHCVSCESGYAHFWATTLEECRRCSDRCFASDNKCYIYGPGQTYTGKDDNGNCTQ